MEKSLRRTKNKKAKKMSEGVLFHQKIPVWLRLSNFLEDEQHVQYR